MTPHAYLVGGYVRDSLLAKEGYPVRPKDRDFVVVGATPEQMVRKGFLPVGAVFPVFLHPKTHEEYALARTERKTAPGYKGFVFHASPDVTLEEDLKRRDLTVNAIALDESGHVIDPWHGQEDLKQRIFRHVSDAFCEDPVRILRLARFCAQFPDFRIHPETWSLVCSMVSAGEVDALVAERVNRELSRGLAGTKPSRMFHVLKQCGAWERIAPMIPCSDPLLRSIDQSSLADAPVEIRFACLLAEAGERSREAAQKLKCRADIADIALLLVKHLRHMHLPVTARSAVNILERADAFRRPERFQQFLAARQLATGESPDTWMALAKAAAATDIRRAIAKAPTKKDIPDMIRRERETSVATLCTDTQSSDPS